MSHGSALRAGERPSLHLPNRDIPTVLLWQGQPFRLPHVMVPQRLVGQASPLVEAALTKLAGVAMLAAEPSPKQDRYGRPIQDILVADTSLVAILLEGGAVLIDLDQDPPATLMALEQVARSQGRGLWAHETLKPLAADRPDRISSGFYIVRGRILSRGQTRSTWYLNFGDRWRTDFTVIIPRTLDAKTLQALAPDALPQGSLVEVRGWVRQKDGPFIRIATHQQISTVGALDIHP